jgi:hypothetical protein
VRTPSSTRSRRLATLASWLLALVLCTTSSVAWAGPRDDVKSAYTTAKQQFNDLDLDAALATLDGAVGRADGAGLSGDPVLGPVHVLRGGIIFSNTGNKAQTLAAFKQAVTVDHNVALPIELRSPDLVKLLEEARRGVPKASNDAIIHTPPTYTRGADLEVTALSNVPMPDGAQLVMYWRKQGDTGEFDGVTMDTFGNHGTAVIPAAQHGDASIEYFIYVFDAKQAALANRGDKERPMVLEAPEGTLGSGPVGKGDGKGDGDGKGKKDKKRASGKGACKEWWRGDCILPRFFINIGVGTGFGIARGTAEQTYQQFTPGPGSMSYGTREQACAVERWYAANAPLARDSVEFGNHLSAISMIGTGVLPAPQADLTAAYDADYCSRRHPVTTGMASAPFHIAPELSLRVSRNIAISLYGRLQVVTGSKVFTEDPTKQATESFNLDVRSGNPEGFRRKPPFSFAIGLKFKYFFGKDEKKFRLYAGAFAGYGFARLRVNMGFANDRNGNSVPDTIESGLSGPTGPDGKVIASTCVPVWPYNQGCVPGTNPDGTGGPGDTDRNLATGVRINTKASDTRIDTVKIGPGMIGGLFGFHYQIVKYFGVFAELNIGGWFPSTSSLLFDLNVGPAITF